MSEVLISIITVTYNAKGTIEDTFESIIPFLSREIEYIVIDGGSSDGTVDLIKSIESHLSHWISEKDAGIYDAMNKGTRVAKGRFIYYINAGDKLLSLPLKELKSDSNSGILCFPVLLSTGLVFYPTINAAIKFRNLLPHQGCFYKNDNFLIYNIKFKIFADFALNQVYYKNRKEILVFKSPLVAYHDTEGVSHHKSSMPEIFDVVKSNYGYFYNIISRGYFKFLGVKNKVNKMNNLIFKK